jgi:oxygen-independent coproporphyrinogen-3 oxidase
MLELDEQSPWSRTTSKTPQIAADEQFVLFYQTACERLESYGYTHYEISNWALPGYECRHNLKYWNGAPYRAFGVGAHSFDVETRFWNTSSLAEYADRIDAGILPIAGREQRTPNIRLEEAFMLGLRRISGFDIGTVAEELGIRYPSDWFTRLRQLQEAGLVSFESNILKLTSAGWLVASGVTEELLWPTLLSTSEATP